MKTGIPLSTFVFGETFVEEHNNTSRTPYKFNGNELDACPSVAQRRREETGLYYYGTRYYDPVTSIFPSVDPLAEKYVFQSPYVYAANNPIIFIDVNGEEPGDPVEGFKVLGKIISKAFSKEGAKEIGDSFKDAFKVMFIEPLDFEKIEITKDTPTKKADSKLKDGLIDPGKSGENAPDNAPVGQGKVMASGESLIGVEKPGELDRGLRIFTPIIESVIELVNPKTSDSVIVQFHFETTPGVRGELTGGGVSRRRETPVTSEDSIKHKILPITWKKH